jgi:hypothetical protein
MAPAGLKTALKKIVYHDMTLSWTVNYIKPLFSLSIPSSGHCQREADTWQRSKFFLNFLGFTNSVKLFWQPVDSNKVKFWVPL